MVKHFQVDFDLSLLYNKKVMQSFFDILVKVYNGCAFFFFFYCVGIGSVLSLHPHTITSVGTTQFDRINV